jgi:hypothetical protein
MTEKRLRRRRRFPQLAELIVDVGSGEAVDWEPTPEEPGSI